MRKRARRSVSRVLSPPERGMTIHLGRPSPSASRDRPGWRRGNPPEPSLAGARPSLLGLAPGGVYRAIAVAGDAVRSYRTLSPLPPIFSHESPWAWRFAFCGTIPGVAPAGRYPAPCFRGARTFLPPARRPESGHPAVWRLLAKRSRARRQPRRFTIPCRRAAVSPSARPSIRAGRKWRWKA